LEFSYYARIIERGSHDELISQKGKYYQLYTGAFFHSDRGWTYTNPSFTERLASLNLTQSLSRIGNPWDNAVIESFFGLLKSEIFYTVKLRLSADQLQGIIERYIKFYNKERIQKKLGYLSPFQYRKLIA